MRILHVSDRASARGGADVHLSSVIRAQSREHTVRLAVGRQDGSAKLSCPIELIPGLDRLGNEAGGCAATGDATLEGSLDALCDRFKPELVHVHNALGPSVLRWAARRGAVMTVQDHRCFCPGRGKLTLAGEVCREPIKRELCEGCFEDAAYFRGIFELTRQRLASLEQMPRLIVLSEYMKRELVAAGLRASRITVIPPFVCGLDRAAAPNGPPCVLFAGRLVATKGARDALEAWRRSGVDLPLVMVGTGSMRAALEQEGCEVLGWVPHEQMAAVYRRARVLVLPSRWQEPFGIVGLEALYMGVPVAAYDGGGVAEWHPGPGLVPWGDVDALAAAIRELAGVSGRLMRSTVEPEKLMNALLRVYQQNISGFEVFDEA